MTPILYILSVDDYISAQKTCMRLSAWTTFFWTAYVFFTVGIFSSLFLDASSFTQMLKAIFIITLTGTIFIFFIQITRYFFPIRRQTEKLFKEDTCWQQETALSWTNTVITTESIGTRNTIPFADIFRFHVSKNEILIYRSIARYHIIPLRIFIQDGSLESFISLAQAAKT